MFPRKITVGYQKRSGTYTGKLAYVIYTDEKGVLRKEKSWNGWRDKTIQADEFKNEPTEGFVLNKKAGGYKSGWDYRQSYCRVYDPRGFEFEITIENLLWILDWCDCIKGKGLSGKFVYTWNYTDLWLEPEGTDRYNKMLEEQKKLFKNSEDSVDELTPGAEYRLRKAELLNYADGKAENTVVYVGKVNGSKHLGLYKEEQLMFIPGSQKNSISDYDQIFFTYKKKENLVEEVQKEAIKPYEIDNLIDRYKKSAYSYEFWREGNIEKFVAGKINWYHTEKLQEITSMFENCFSIANDGSYVKSYLPIFCMPFKPRSSGYYGYYDEKIRNKDKFFKGYMFNSCLTTGSPVEFHKTYSPYDSSYCREDVKGMSFGYYNCRTDRNDNCAHFNMLIETPMKQYAKAETYHNNAFEAIYDSKTELYYLREYLFDNVSVNNEIPGDCLYVTNDGYVSDSFARLNVFNHFITTEENLAKIMTLPYKTNNI